MADIIALLSEALEISGASVSVTANAACTKQVAENISCYVNNDDGYYTSQYLLVRKKDLTKRTISVTISAKYLYGYNSSGGGTTIDSKFVDVTSSFECNYNQAVEIHANDSVYGFVFQKWSDGDTNSTRTIHPKENTTLYALYGTTYHIGFRTSNWWSSVYSAGSYDSSTDTIYNVFPILCEGSGNNNHVIKVTSPQFGEYFSRYIPSYITFYSADEVSHTESTKLYKGTDYQFKAIIDYHSDLRKDWKIYCPNPYDNNIQNLNLDTAGYNLYYYSVPEKVHNVGKLCVGSYFKNSKASKQIAWHDNKNKIFILGSNAWEVTFDFLYYFRDDGNTSFRPQVDIYLCGTWLPGEATVISGKIYKNASKDGAITTYSSSYNGVVKIHYYSGQSTANVNSIKALFNNKGLSNLSFVADAHQYNDYGDSLINLC